MMERQRERRSKCERIPADHPFGNCDSWTVRSFRCDARSVTRGDILSNDEEGRTIFPRYFQRAKGAYLWDVDGNRYIDFLLGYGPVVLGHADERVTEAVVRELSAGNCIAPLWSPRQVELCELLREVIPGAQLCYLLKTGSDANSAAVRLARIFTERSKVLRWGYNGWHDWAAGLPAGIPTATRADTVVFDDGSPESLGALFARYPGEIACVLTMPFEYEVIPSDRLRLLRDIAHEHGALLILDEMRSGFRMALGGAQQYFGLEADLVTLSKAMANGYPISAVAGRAEVMECLGRTQISSTFYASPVEMAAALATISTLKETDAIGRLWSLGSALQDGLSRLVEAYDLPAEVVGYPPSPFLRFRPGCEDLKRCFFAETTRLGVLLHPGHQWFVSAAHTAEDVAYTVDVCRRACEAARDGWAG